MTDPTTDLVLTMAATDEALPDDAFVMISRALAGLDPVTGERPEPTLPARMTGRGWRRGVMDRVEVGEYIGWYWRCPRRSCPEWGGPFRHEHQARDAGREAHHEAHVPGKRDPK